jgi:hypothetical protein
MALEGDNASMADASSPVPSRRKQRPPGLDNTAALLRAPILPTPTEPFTNEWNRSLYTSSDHRDQEQSTAPLCSDAASTVSDYSKPCSFSNSHICYACVTSESVYSLFLTMQDEQPAREQHAIAQPAAALSPTSAAMQAEQRKDSAAVAAAAAAAVEPTPTPPTEPSSRKRGHDSCNGHADVADSSTGPSSPQDEDERCAKSPRLTSPHLQPGTLPRMAPTATTTALTALHVITAAPHSTGTLLLPTAAAVAAAAAAMPPPVPMDISSSSHSNNGNHSHGSNNSSSSIPDTADLLQPLLQRSTSEDLVALFPLLTGASPLTLALSTDNNNTAAAAAAARAVSSDSGSAEQQHSSGPLRLDSLGSFSVCSSSDEQVYIDRDAVMTELHLPPPVRQAVNSIGEACCCL